MRCLSCNLEINFSNTKYHSHRGKCGICYMQAKREERMRVTIALGGREERR
jgi:hypothetical protein